MIVAKAKDGSGKKASCKKTVSTSSTPSKPNLPENNETIITTPEQLFGVEPRSEADCEYPLDWKLSTKTQVFSIFYCYKPGGCKKQDNPEKIFSELSCVNC